MGAKGDTLSVRQKYRLDDDQLNSERNCFEDTVPLQGFLCLCAKSACSESTWKDGSVEKRRAGLYDWQDSKDVREYCHEAHSVFCCCLLKIRGCMRMDNNVLSSQVMEREVWRDLDK